MESNCNKAHTNEPQQNTYTQSVTGIVIRDHKVLLARHTYGVGKNRLIVPGGYLEPGETPQEALRREYLEETSIVVEPKEVIGIRFTRKTGTSPLPPNTSLAQPPPTTMKTARSSGLISMRP